MSILNHGISPSEFSLVNADNGRIQPIIDEFQDTSVLQWQNFMPLLENTVSTGKMNLLVGDAKQSIYKFQIARSRRENWKCGTNIIRSGQSNTTPGKKRQAY